MKKLLFLALIVGVAYATWKYLEQVQQSAAANQNRLKSPSEKALKDMDKEWGSSQATSQVCLNESAR